MPLSQGFRLDASGSARRLERLPLSVAIPTYRRSGVLIDTVDQVANLSPQPSEILVIDQTERHDLETEERLATRNEAGLIRWIRLPQPSIPRAMNTALRAANSPLVVFLDDDVRPDPKLLEAHLIAQGQRRDLLVAGRVLQPWDPLNGTADERSFASIQQRDSRLFMGGNFSLRRDAALAVGGFDENFVRVAYNFEKEFAHRWLAAGNSIMFEPDASLHHLKVRVGGTRSYGEHLTTFDPGHAVGAYYHLLRTWSGRSSLKELISRPVRSVVTRHHLRHPWWIPVTLGAELAGMVWAMSLARRGPALVRRDVR